MTIGLMRRQHVVVRSDNANVRRYFRVAQQYFFVGLRRGVAVGEVGAAQVSTRGGTGCTQRAFLQIGIATALAALADFPCDFCDDGMSHDERFRVVMTVS